MVKLFRQNMAIQASLVVLALVLLWLRPMLDAPSMEPGDHPAVLYGLLCAALDHAPRLAVVLAMVLVLAEGVMLNLALSNVGLVSQNSLLPTFLYVVAASAGASTLTPVLLVNLAIIGCLQQLMLHGTLLTIPAGKACGATALIGIATLFYQPAVFFMAGYLLVAANYRLYGWKDWLVMLLGFAAPYVALVTVLYMTDGIAPWWQTTADALRSFRITAGEADTWQTIAGIVFAVILLWSYLHTGSRLSERPAKWQKNAGNVMLMALGSVAILFYAPLLPPQPPLFAIPFAFCANRLLLGQEGSGTGFGHRKKRTWVYDIALILAIATAFLC